MQSKEQQQKLITDIGYLFHTKVNMFADVTYIFKILFKHRQFLVEILLNIFFRVFNKYWTHGHTKMNGFHLQKTGFTQKPVPLGPVCTIVPSVYYLQWVIHVQFENCVLNRCAKKKTRKKRRKHLTHAQKLPSILSEKRTVEVPLGPKIVLSSHFMDSLRLIPKLLS